MDHTGIKSLLKFLYKKDCQIQLKKLFQEYKEKTDYQGDYSAFTTFLSRLNKKELVKKPKRGVYQINDRGKNAVEAWDKEKNRSKYNGVEYDDKYETILLKNGFKEEIGKALHEQKHFLLDLSEFSKQHMDILEELEENPEIEYNYLSEAFKRIQERNYFKKDFFQKTESHIFLSNIPGYLRKSIVSAKSSKYLGELVSVEGMVVQKTELHPVLVKTEYECVNCGDRVVKEHKDKEKPPHKCDCGSRSFDSVKNIYEDVFSVWIQENMDEGVGKSQDIQVVFQGSYVDEKLRNRFTVGNQMKVAGIPRDIEADNNSLKRNVYLEGLGFDIGELSWDNVELTDKDKEKLEKISREKFINSHATHLVGEDTFLMRKAGCIGVVGAHDRKTTKRKTMRGNIHVLFVTPPSEGKSDILKSFCRIYPRSEYADCTNSTATGLIAAAERDENTGEWRLKAKTLVKANKGVACLDEFDNLSDSDASDYEKLNEAMESGQASIEKASISTTLPTNTSIIAAANPKYGDFDLNSSIVDQFPNAAASTLSRFSLQVVSKGVQKKELDRKVADAMQGKVESDEILSEKVLRKYVKYAKSFEPEWTDDCRERVSSFYADIREKSDNIGQKVRARMVRTVQNVALALARMDFCKKASIQHVEESIGFLKELFRRKGFDLEQGEFDVDYVDGGKGRNALRKDVLLDVLPDEGEGMALEDVYDCFEEMEGKVDGLLEELEDQGEIFEPRPGFLKKL